MHMSVLKISFYMFGLRTVFVFANSGYTCFCFATFVRTFSLGGTCHVRLGEPGVAYPGELGAAAEFIQHINKKSKNPTSRA